MRDLQECKWWTGKLSEDTVGRIPFGLRRVPLAIGCIYNVYFSVSIQKSQHGMHVRWTAVDMVWLVSKGALTQRPSSQAMGAFAEIAWYSDSSFFCPPPCCALGVPLSLCPWCRRKIPVPFCLPPSTCAASDYQGEYLRWSETDPESICLLRHMWDDPPHSFISSEVYLPHSGKQSEGFRIYFNGDK